MNSKRNNWIWFILIAVIGLIILYYLNKSSEGEPIFDDSDSNKKPKRISNLNKEKSILSAHLNIISELQDKIEKQSEKIWRKFIRLLILIFVFCNGFILGMFYLFTNKIIFSDVLTLYSFLYFGFILLYFFITYKFFSIKKFIFEWLKEYSYKIVAGSRDAEYFESKSETIQNRIEQIELELKQLLN